MDRISFHIFDDVVVVVVVENIDVVDDIVVVVADMVVIDTEHVVGWLVDQPEQHTVIDFELV